MRASEAWVLGYVLNSTWQVPLLFAAAWLAARVVRRARAAAEHRVWVGALLLQGVLPACSLGGWPWMSGMLSGLLSAGRAGGAGEGRVSVVMSGGAAAGTLQLPAWLLHGVCVVYGLCVAYFGARLLWRMARVVRLRRRATRVDLTAERAECWRRCGERLGVKDAGLAASQEVFGPVTIGVWRRLILLPHGMADSLPLEDLETVLAHELAHIRRRDYAKNFLYELIALPVAYHPLLWLTRTRVVAGREEICDELAAEAGAGRERYARSLLRLASSLLEGRPATVPHAIGIFDANRFERRVMKLTEERTAVRGMRRVATVAGCMAIAAGTCASALTLRMAVAAPAGASAADGAPKTKPPLRIPSDVMAGTVLTKVNPTYPESARKAKIQGAVVLKAVIGKDGTIEKLQVMSGPEELRRSTLDAVRQWTYKPYLLNGEAVDVDTTITVNYSLGS